MAASAKPLRQAMPETAGFIDFLRDAFGAETVNASIRNGVAGGSHFYAEENGQVIGSDRVPGRVEVNLADIVLSKPEKETA